MRLRNLLNCKSHEPLTAGIQKQTFIFLNRIPDPFVLLRITNPEDRGNLITTPINPKTCHNSPRSASSLVISFVNPVPRLVLKFRNVGYNRKHTETKKAPQTCGACSRSWARTSDPLINSQML